MSFKNEKIEDKNTSSHCQVRKKCLLGSNFVCRICMRLYSTARRFGLSRGAGALISDKHLIGGFTKARSTGDDQSHIL